MVTAIGSVSSERFTLLIRIQLLPRWAALFLLTNCSWHFRSYASPLSNGTSTTSDHGSLSIGVKNVDRISRRKGPETGGVRLSGRPGIGAVAEVDHHPIEPFRAISGVCRSEFQEPPCRSPTRSRAKTQARLVTSRCPDGKLPAKRAARDRVRGPPSGAMAPSPARWQNTWNLECPQDPSSTLK